MRIIAEKTLCEYWEKHAIVQKALEAWLEEVHRANWKKPSDLQYIYGNDVVLPNNRAVFNIKGNAYRLIVHIHYKSNIVFIRFIGTHAEYDKIAASTL